MLNTLKDYILSLGSRNGWVTPGGFVAWAFQLLTGEVDLNLEACSKTGKHKKFLGIYKSSIFLINLNIDQFDHLINLFGMNIYNSFRTPTEKAAFSFFFLCEADPVSYRRYKDNRGWARRYLGRKAQLKRGARCPARMLFVGIYKPCEIPQINKLNDKTMATKNQANKHMKV